MELTFPEEVDVQHVCSTAAPTGWRQRQCQARLRASRQRQQLNCYLQILIKLEDVWYMMSVHVSDDLILYK